MGSIISSILYKKPRLFTYLLIVKESKKWVFYKWWSTIIKTHIWRFFLPSWMPSHVSGKIIPFLFCHSQQTLSCFFHRWWICWPSLVFFLFINDYESLCLTLMHFFCRDIYSNLQFQKIKCLQCQIRRDWRYPRWQW